MTLASTQQAARTAKLRSASEAALVLAVGMGFGRFAFTAVYPHMVEEGILTLQGGSMAASANYAGYLVGAILAMRVHARNAHRLCLWSMIGTAFCLALLATFTATWAIVALRGAAGAFSALSMVAASLWLLEHRGHAQGAPLLYAGVGVGIALSAELLVLGAHAGLHSRGLWLMLALVTLVIGLATLPGLLASGSQSTGPVPQQATGAGRVAVVASRPLVLLYGLAGLGYIVTATYLPLLVKEALPDLDSAHVWAIFGLGAIPSCFVWHRIHARLGTRSALRANLLIQAVGVALPVLTQTTAGYLLSAFLVGGTFMGTVTIAMPAAQGIARRTGANLLATMTVLYGTGQIAGPILAEVLYTYTQAFSSALAAAAGALLIATLLTVRL